ASSGRSVPFSVAESGLCLPPGAAGSSFPSNGAIARVRSRLLRCICFYDSLGCCGQSISNPEVQIKNETAVARLSDYLTGDKWSRPIKRMLHKLGFINIMMQLFYSKSVALKLRSSF
ncbi:MAG: hypothetical protein KFF50_00875, partial [Desulfatitalea sp.]|nr:hypothetical protein [Desulfatitalea sp.]